MDVKSKESIRKMVYRYGMDETDFQELLEKQDYKCPMCKRDLRDVRVHIDHDHACCSKRPNRQTCGKCIRGLLCGTCNQALGFYEKHHAACEQYLANRATN